MAKIEKAPKEPKAKKPIFKKWWFWVIIAVVLIIIIAGSGGSKDKPKETTPATQTNEPAKTAPTTAPTSKPTEAPKTDPKEEQKEELKKKEALVWFGDVRNDTTGNWRLSEYSESDSQETFAVDYYKAFFENDKEIHAVINMTNKTTACLSMIDSNTIDVTIHEYVKGEEHDAKVLFGGDVLKEFWVYIDSGKIEELKD